MASVGDSGSGNKRASSFELNLVPFIDLMSVMITFLLKLLSSDEDKEFSVEQLIKNTLKLVLKTALNSANESPRT